MGKSLVTVTLFGNIEPTVHYFNQEIHVLDIRWNI